jgi:hypothetical protein
VTEGVRERDTDAGVEVGRTDAEDSERPRNWQALPGDHLFDREEIG